uniref:Uncharacterized protein n=1 Tax=Plectus sambesii TaxID=2011161 RepID=A0A914WGQ0_9BILA
MESQQQRHDSMSDDDDIVLTDVVMSQRSNIVEPSPVADSTVHHPQESKPNLKKKQKPAGGPSQKKSALDSLFDDLLHKPDVDTDQKEATDKIQHYHEDDVCCIRPNAKSTNLCSMQRAPADWRVKEEFRKTLTEGTNHWTAEDSTKMECPQCRGMVSGLIEQIAVICRHIHLIHGHVPTMAHFPQQNAQQLWQQQNTAAMSQFEIPFVVQIPSIEGYEEEEIIDQRQQLQQNNPDRQQQRYQQQMLYTDGRPGAVVASQAENIPVNQQQQRPQQQMLYMDGRPGAVVAPQAENIPVNQQQRPQQQMLYSDGRPGTVVGPQAELSQSHALHGQQFHQMSYNQQQQRQ